MISTVSYIHMRAEVQQLLDIVQPLSPRGFLWFLELCHLRKLRAHLNKDNEGDKTQYCVVVFKKKKGMKKKVLKELVQRRRKKKKK